MINTITEVFNNWKNTAATTFYVILQVNVMISLASVVEWVLHKEFSRCKVLEKWDDDKCENTLNLLFSHSFLSIFLLVSLQYFE